MTWVITAKIINRCQDCLNECKDEIMKAHKRIKELTGIEMDLFRPPFGDYNNMVVGTARKCGYYTIQWDVDSLDWKELRCR